jgi:hypothetical protein
MSDDNQCVKCGRYSGGSTLCLICQKTAVNKAARKPKTIMASVPIASLELLYNSAANDIAPLEPSVYTRQVERAIETAKLAVKKAKLRRGIFE